MNNRCKSMSLLPRPRQHASKQLTEPRLPAKPTSSDRTMQNSKERWQSYMQRRKQLRLLLHLERSTLLPNTWRLRGSLNSSPHCSSNGTSHVLSHGARGTNEPSSSPQATLPPKTLQLVTISYLHSRQHGSWVGRTLQCDTMGYCTIERSN